MIRTVFLTLVGILVVFLFLSPFFIKVKVQCASQFGNCPKDVLAELEKFSDTNLFLAKRKLSKYLRTNLIVSDFSMQYKLPNILIVSILVKKPQFAILDKATGSFGVVDSDGIIISVLPDSSLPTVVLDNKNLHVGDKVSTQDFFALKLMKGIWAMYQVGVGEVQNNSLVVELPGGVKVIFPQEGDIDVLLGEVRLVYGKVESPDTVGKYSQIDLRFKNPVLR